MKKIYINPKVPEWMDDKAIEDRSETHLNKWWCRAYIRTEEYGEDTYIDYCERMAYTQADDYLGEYKLETEEEFDKRRKEGYEQWLKWWPEGVRYDVRILDGGAWDRTTNKGHFNNLDEAIEYAKSLMS